MTLYTAALSLHVMVAIAGTGLLGAIPIAASFARRTSMDPAPIASLIERLFRYTRASFAIMFLSGVVLDYTAGGAFHERGWFRSGFALLVVAGLSQFRAQAALRRVRAKEADAESALRSVERWGWAMCGAVTLIALLMEAKPF
ncbi:hypothetical protein [Pendulispora albinea]|uniref:Copper resistance protein D domain-containing protein n=1 Tax=Pendulispora albinea TaxID=2741071 RepID=A0ABZ2MB06_9BACT